MDPRAVAAWELARPGHDLPFSTACVAPWVSLELDPAGWAYACCANQTYPLGRVGEQRLGELWSGERIEVLRAAVRRWDLSVGCQSCRWHLEHQRMDPDAAVYEQYPIDDPDPAGPTAMTFALSNRCNLGCVMCNPALSSTLRHEAGMAPLASPYDDGFFEDLAGFLPRLRYAKFLGGEPFLIPEHHRVWDLMDEVGGPPRMQVTTNGTVWSERIEWLLERFAFDVTVSIDAATAPTYEAIRRGASFDKVQENVGRLRAACDRAGTELRTCFCLMDRNWHELGAYLAWATEHRAAVSVNVVSDAGLSLHDLPLAALDEVAAAWQAEEPSLVGRLGANQDVWDVQRRQLDAVRAERRAGVPVPSKQPARVPPGLLAAPLGPSAAPGASIAEQRATLSAWAGAGPVAEVHLDPDRRVTVVASAHPRLGIDGSAVGRSAADLLGAMAAADGRPMWLLDAEVFEDHAVQVIGLSTNPVRGNPGCMVRMVELPVAGGWVLLVAEDRLLDEPVEVAQGVDVELRPAGTGPDRRGDGA